MEELLGTIIAGLAIYGTISLIWCIIMIVANWKIFTKAGQPGWMSIIPFLNSFILFKISWNTMMFWIMVGAGVVGGVLNAIAGEEGGILSILALICYLAAAVIGIIDVHKLSKSFGHGIGFTLGLLFFSPIFTLILGFGKSEYLGPNGEGAANITTM
jgi:hypothetical protein